jgi:hypothetical protein
MIGDAQQWRLDAARCLLLAAESATSLETREELIALGHMWLRRAGKLESDLAKIPDELEKALIEGMDIST